MTGQTGMIDEQALAWVIRTRDPEFTDWEAFTLWLEAAPANAAAYDALAATDDALPAILPPARKETVLPVPANDPGTLLWRRWRWVGGGTLAAALVAVLSVSMLQDRAAPWSVTTRPGEHREITLADGTRVALNGGTTLRMDRASPRMVELAGGEAMFTVIHDASDPFEVHVGTTVLRDIGTVFNVTRDDGMTRVGVAEGEVLFNPAREAIALTAGRTLRVRDGNGAPAVSNVDTGAVGAWHAGRLVYTGAALPEIATDIARNLGVSVRADGAANGQRFTGTILLDRNPDRFFAGAAPLLGVSAMREGDGWTLKAIDGANR